MHLPGACCCGVMVFVIGWAATTAGSRWAGATTPTHQTQNYFTSDFHEINNTTLLTGHVPPHYRWWEAPMTSSLPTRSQEAPMTSSLPTRSQEAPMTTSLPTRSQEAPMTTSLPTRSQEAPMTSSLPTRSQGCWQAQGALPQGGLRFWMRTCHQHFYTYRTKCLPLPPDNFLLDAPLQKWCYKLKDDSCRNCFISHFVEVKMFWNTSRSNWLSCHTFARRQQRFIFFAEQTF